MTVSSYSRALRGALGEPWAVSDRLWRELTSIEEGDEAAYGRALRQVGDMTRKYFLGSARIAVSAPSTRGFCGASARRRLRSNCYFPPNGWTIICERILPLTVTSPSG